MYCPRCATNNREGSKFCNNCGALLTPPADVSCPECGVTNPANSAICRNCGARLAPPTPERKSSVLPIKGLSLPSKGKAAPSLSAASDAGAAQDNEQARNAPPPSSPQETAASIGADVPDWLAQLRAVPAVEEETTVPPVPGDIPDWIRRLQSVQPEETAPEPSLPVEQPPAPLVPSEEPTGLPGWLMPSDESSWVAPQEPAAPAARPIDETPTPSEEMPSLLPVPPAEESSGALPTELPQEGMPPATEGSISSPVEEQTTLAPQADTGTEPGLPDWLRGLETREPTASEATAEEAPLIAETEMPPTEPGTPDWLLAGTNDEQQPDLAQVPEWLRLAMPAQEPPAAVSQEPDAEAAGGDATSAEITSAEPSAEPVYPASDWVPPRARVVRMPAGAGTQAAEPAEQGNVLAGLRGVLPLAVAVAEPHTGTEKPAAGAMNEKDDGARLFEAILAEAPAEAEPAPTPPKPRAFSMRPIIYAMLFLAVIVPFFLPRGLAGSLLRISKTPAADVYDLIQALPTDATVLVAFDYEPSVAGEMDLVARAMMRHLVQRRIKIIAVSTLDTGPQIAQEVIGSAIANNKDYRYGAEYLNFGYIPGHEAGLASLAANGLPPHKDYGRGLDIKQYPITVNLKSPNDVALIVELAGSEDVLRMWMEQVQPRVGTRIIAGVSAAVEPKAQVYRRPAQLAGLVSGLVGAAQYEVLSNQPGQAITSVNAQTAAQIVLILVIVAGNIVYWIGRAGGGKTGLAAEKAK